MARSFRREKHWWTVQHGGAPRWLLLLTGIFLIACAVTVLAFRPVDVAQPTGTQIPVMSTENDDKGPFVIAYIGDSYTSGSFMNDGPESLWTSKVEGDFVPFRLAAGGTGYVSASEGGAPKSFVGQAARVPDDSNIVIFLGSRNDGQVDYETIRTAALKAFSQASANAPSATIVVIGPVWTNATPPTGVVEASRAVGDAARTAGLLFVDPLAEKWFAEMPGLIGSDGVHPTNAGHLYLAEKIQPLLDEAVAIQTR